MQDKYTIAENGTEFVPSYLFSNKNEYKQEVENDEKVENKAHEIVKTEEPSYDWVPLRAGGRDLQAPKITPLKSENNTLQHKKPKNSASYKKESHLGGQGSISELDRLINVAVEKHKNFPPSALEMGIEGRVRVSFFLYKDGNIENFNIIKSSGFQSFDDAAKSAVYKATPFVGVEKYVNKRFLVIKDVVFDRNENRF